MNTIMAIVLKVLFHHGLSLSYILIHLVIFRNGPTNVSNSGKGVLVLCCVSPHPPRRGLGPRHKKSNKWSSICCRMKVICILVTIVILNV